MSTVSTVTSTLPHPAAEDVNAGRLPQEDAGHVLEATLMSALTPPPG